MTTDYSTLKQGIEGENDNGFQEFSQDLIFLHRPQIESKGILIKNFNIPFKFASKEFNKSSKLSVSS